MRTEAVHPASENLDKMSPEEIIKLMADEDAKAIDAIRKAADSLAKAIHSVASCFRRGGSTIYVGAGTSGRIGAADAAEMPPTFGVDRERFVALIAGRAFTHPSEGAEDDREQARRDLDNILFTLGPGVAPVPDFDSNQETIRANPHLLVGISASGQTPYVLEAVLCAKERGMETVGIANNPHSELLEAVDVPVFLDTGPEVLAGSTRLKAGTSQKTALNIIGLGAMVMCGRVTGNLMTHMKPVSEKLRQRAIRIVMAQLGVGPEEALSLLEKADWSIPVALGKESNYQAGINLD